MSDTPLLDMLCAADPVAPWWVPKDKLPLWRKHRDGMLYYVRHPELPTFNIAGIANYYYEINPREYWDLHELTGLEVPHGCCWMEHPLAERIHSEIGDQNVAALTKGHAGFLAMQAKRADAEGIGIPPEADRILVFETFIHYEVKHQTDGPHGAWFFALDSAGRILSVPWLQGFHDPRHNDHIRLLQTYLWPPLLAMSNQAVAGRVN